MTWKKRQRAERPFARVVSDKQEAAATIALGRWARALPWRLDRAPQSISARWTDAASLHHGGSDVRVLNAALPDRN
jgi:hypothetical protein